jgi:hypothetical protein
MTAGPTSQSPSLAGAADEEFRVTESRSHRLHPSPLSSADAAFRLLTRGPEPLSLHGSRIGGLPSRLIPLDELKRLLLRPSTSAQARDAAWAVLVTRARDEGSAWTIGTVGVAMPALRRAAGILARGYRGDTADIDAEVLTGFLSAVRSLNLEAPGIALRLRWAAYRAGAAFRSAEGTWASRAGDPDWAVPPRRLSGHPDLILATAVEQGVITPDDAALIGSTRLETIPLVAAASALNVPYDAARMRRSRAESRLVSAIRAGDLSDIAFDGATRDTPQNRHGNEQSASGDSG